MARLIDQNGNGEDAGGGPRRSGLVQERSRNTRRELVRTALALWAERGFENGVEETTVEEIARAAGVTKGTFYFHFAHKEDILLEIGWAAAEAMLAETHGAMRRERSAVEVVDALLSSLAHRVSKTPRAAIIRSAAEFARRRHDMPTRPDGALGFRDAFAAIVRYAIERGDLPSAVDADDIAMLLEAATMDTLVSWAESGDSASVLRARLQRRAEVILSGASVVYAWRSPGFTSAE
jgi:AcrR family transcriptional regulator